MKIPGNSCTTYYRSGSTGTLGAEAPIAHVSVMVLSSQGMSEALCRFGDLSSQVCFSK